MRVNSWPRPLPDPASPHDEGSDQARSELPANGVTAVSFVSGVIWPNGDTPVYLCIPHFKKWPGVLYAHSLRLLTADASWQIGDMHRISVAQAGKITYCPVYNGYGGRWDRLNKYDAMILQSAKDIFNLASNKYLGTAWPGTIGRPGDLKKIGLFT